jgi:hypothetical protein
MFWAITVAVVAADPLVPPSVTSEMLQPRLEAPTFRLGVFDLRPRASVGLTYDDNITLSDTERIADEMFVVSPELLATADRREGGVGALLTLQYRPAAVFYVDRSENNTVNHLVRLSGSWAMAKLTLGFSQQFQQVTAGMVEAGERVRQRFYNTDLTALYAWSPATSIEVNPRLTITDNDQLIGSTEWGADIFLNRVLTPKLTASVGGSGGYVDIENEADQQYERVLLRVQFAAAAKLDLSAYAGGEWRQYDSGNPGTFQPVFSLSASYRPLSDTTVTLEAHRRVQASAVLTGQDINTTGFTAELRQRVMTKFYVALAGGYDNRDYGASVAGVTATREDNYWMVRPGVGADFAHNWSLFLYYQYQENVSNSSGFSFNNNQVGALVAWGF